LTHFPKDVGTLVVFSGRRYEDDTTRALQALAGEWHALHDSDRAAAAKQIADAKIDVLIELGGHTAHSRIALTPMRPAPVIASYLGYAATTGFPSIHARVVDAVTDSPASDAFHTERLYRIDRCFVCYSPPSELPALPNRPQRPITFGSFGSVLKLSDASLDLWAKVLHAVPGSRLVLKAAYLEKPIVRDFLLDRLAQRGIDQSRVTIEAFTPGVRDHLLAYANIDIALDTIPYAGVTTTCEALIMGVPIVSLAGEHHHERTGLSILRAVGLDEFVATSPDEYVRISTSLANDAAKRTLLHTSLRQRVLASSLCDAQAHALAFAGAVRQVWTDARQT
jgi:predicted O-linked N-acetylglucosamine transferase (SPINDLY family)